MNIYIKNIIKFSAVISGFAAFFVFITSVAGQQRQIGGWMTLDGLGEFTLQDGCVFRGMFWSSRANNCTPTLAQACSNEQGQLEREGGTLRCIGGSIVTMFSNAAQRQMEAWANECTDPNGRWRGVWLWESGRYGCYRTTTEACSAAGGRMIQGMGCRGAGVGTASGASINIQTISTQPTAQPGTSPRPTASVTEAQRLAQAQNIAARSFNSLFRFPITAVADAINQPVGGVVMAQVPANIGGITEMVEVALEKGDNNRLCVYLPDGAEIDPARPQGVSSASGAPTAMGQLLDIFRSTRAPAFQFDRNFLNSICITNVSRASALTARFGIKFTTEVQGQAVAAVTGAPVPSSGATPPRPTTPATTPAAPTTGAAQPRPSQAAQPTPSVPATGVTPSGKLPAQPSAQPAAPSAVCPSNLQAIVNRAVNETCRKGAACISRVRATLEAQLKRDRRYINCDVYPYFAEAEQPTAAVACPTVDEALLFDRIDVKCKKGSTCTRAEFAFFVRQYPNCGFSAETFM